MEALFSDKNPEIQNEARKHPHHAHKVPLNHAPFAGYYLYLFVMKAPKGFLSPFRIDAQTKRRVGEGPISKKILNPS